MSTCTKIAVTVPTETYEAVERVRQRLGKSRSATITLALQEWLRGLEVSDADRRYMEAYLRQPERVDDVRAIAALATAHWEPWVEEESQTRRPRIERHRGRTRRRTS